MKNRLYTSIINIVLYTGVIITSSACGAQTSGQFNHQKFKNTTASQGAGIYATTDRRHRRRSQKLRGVHKHKLPNNKAMIDQSDYNPNVSGWNAYRSNMKYGGRYWGEGYNKPLNAPMQTAQPATRPEFLNRQGNRTQSYPRYENSVNGPVYDVNVARQANTHSVPVSDWMSLQRSMKAAQLRSPKLDIEQYKIKEAEEALEQAKAQSRFKLDFNANTGLTQSETVFNVVNRTDNEFRVRRSAELDLSLPIYEGGRLKAQKNSANVGVKAAGTDFLAVESNVAQDTALAHLNVVRDRKLVDIYQKNVGLLKKQQDTASLMLQNGENTISDKALIDTRLAAIRVRLQQAETRLKNSQATYRKLVGESPGNQLAAPVFNLPQSLYEVKSIAQNNNPEIRAAKARAEAARYDIDIAKSSARPKLALQGILRGAQGQSNTISRDTAAEVLLNFRMPILSGGENKSKVRQALLAQSRISHEIHDTYETLNERAEQLWNNLQAARINKDLYDQQILSAQQAYDTITQQKNAGLATVLDQLSVEQTLLDAYVSRIESEAQEQSTSVQLLALLGKLAPN